MLGTTNLEVSALGLGTVELGMPYGIGDPAPPPDTECIRLLHRAFEAGITYFDTAAGYGRSEELLGKAFSSWATRPVIATKATIHQREDGTLLAGPALFHHLEDSVLNSLRQLGMQELDLVQIHAPANGRFVGSELLAAMAELTRRGLVRYWGASTYGEEQPQQVLQHENEIRTLQVAYNLLDRRLKHPIFRSCAALGVGLILRSVFLKGVLSDRLERLPETLAPIRRAGQQAKGLAGELGISLPALALRYAAFQPQIHVALIGTADHRELAANLAAFAAGPLPPDMVARIEEIRTEDEVLLNPGNWSL